MRAALLQWSGFFVPSGEPYDYWHSTSSATRCHWHSDRNAFRLLHDPSRRCLHGHLAQGQSRQQPVGTLRYGHDLRPCQQESGPVRGLRRQWLSERHLGLRRIHVEPGLQPERSLTPRSLGNRLRRRAWRALPTRTSRTASWKLAARSVTVPAGGGPEGPRASWPRRA